MKRTAIYALIRNGQYEDAAFELLNEQSPLYDIHVGSPRDAFPVLKKYGAKTKEHFVILLLNGAHSVIKEEVISIGLVNRTVVHPREIFRPAIIGNAVAIIMCHNHPSGSLDPSPEDVSITKRMKRSGDLLGISVIDHLIVSKNGFYSFTEHGLIDPLSNDEAIEGD